jgi:YesN/AraC family two-component response regulator
MGWNIKTANYFHEVFKKQTGLTPTEWLSQG